MWVNGVCGCFAIVSVCLYGLRGCMCGILCVCVYGWCVVCACGCMGALGFVCGPMVICTVLVVWVVWVLGCMYFGG